MGIIIGPPFTTIDKSEKLSCVGAAAPAATVFVATLLNVSAVVAATVAAAVELTICNKSMNIILC